MGILLFALCLFSAFRLALYGLNYPLFSALGVTDVLKAFLAGLRFDFSVISTFIGPVILLLNLPIRSKNWVKGCLFFITLELALLACFMCADLIYFPVAKHHLAEELLIMSAADWKFVAFYAFTQSWGILLGLAVLLFGGTLWVNRRVDRYYVFRQRGWLTELLIWVLLSAVFVAGVRGHVDTSLRAISIADVYKADLPPGAATLTINGPFTAWHTYLRGYQSLPPSDYPTAQAITNTQKLLFAGQEKRTETAYPLMRLAKNRQDQPNANYVVVLLESWPVEYTDSLSHAGVGITPNFDKLVQGGVNFTNAFSVGHVSIYGFVSVFMGLPMVPGMPYIKYGLELASATPLPKDFAKAGYDTFFAQTSSRDFYQLCAVAKRFGAAETYCKEDIPMRLSYIEESPYGYDYEAYMLVADRIKARKNKHFWAMISTGTTHDPFTRTLERFEKYPYKNYTGRFKNTVAYSDWALGEFIQRAKTDGWFDDTVFIFVADHIPHFQAAKTLRETFRVPLVVYGPRFFKPGERGYVVSQTDVLPTLYELAGLSAPYTALGRNLFDDVPGRVAFVSDRVAFMAEGVDIGLITDKGAIRHNRQKLLQVEKETDDFDVKQAEDALLSLDKAAYTLLKENRWYEEESAKLNRVH